MLIRLFIAQLLLIMAGVQQTAAAEPIDQARRLVQLAQGPTILQQMFNSLTPQIMNLALSKDPELADDKKAKIETIVIEELENAIPDFLEGAALLYARNFSKTELEDIIAFYESQTGKKFTALAPQLMQESMTQGQALGQVVGTRVIERLRAEGNL